MSAELPFFESAGKGVPGTLPAASHLGLLDAVTSFGKTIAASGITAPFP
ncbi:MAG: hypothetical protein K1X78_24845 [Verrucomicrobiaceae bacterium]|nr:hypothetical protein [Verrucomicrobiaceae bacterium]